MQRTVVPIMVQRTTGWKVSAFTTTNALNLNRNEFLHVRRYKRSVDHMSTSNDDKGNFFGCEDCGKIRFSKLLSTIIYKLSADWKVWNLM
jgi:hypothetical protein